MEQNVLVWSQDKGNGYEHVLINPKEVKNEQKRMVLDSGFSGYETELVVTEDYVTLDEWVEGSFQTGSVGRHQYVKPILGKDGSVCHDYLIIIESDWTGEAETLVEMVNREELNAHLENLGRDAKLLIKDIDEIRDRSVIAILRRDNDFAEDMDELGFDPHSTIAVDIFNVDSDRNEDVYIDSIKMGLGKLLRHESTGNQFMLVNKDELARAKKHRKTNSNDFEM